MKSARDLLKIMSPTTLASLIADVQQLDKAADRDELEIERLATRLLADILGDDEAKRMIADAAK